MLALSSASFFKGALFLKNMPRVTFYFDGFNFYNGLKESIKKDPTWRGCYWIDPVQFCKNFIGENELV